jgi:hypothetical protein
MVMKKRFLVLRIVSAIFLIFFVVLFSGCLSGPHAGNQAPPASPMNTPNVTAKETIKSTGVSNSTQNVKKSDNKNLVIVVNSAVQNKTMSGFNPRSGNKIAVINVSITNNNPADIFIGRDQLFIQTEKGNTFDQRGDIAEEFARTYLRFPLTIHPGETKTGPVVYIIFSGTRTNNLVLTDENLVITSIVDLNQIYQYE